MKFTYNSTHGSQKELPGELVRQIREYLEPILASPSFHSKEQLHDAMLAFRTTDGKRLLMNQLEPIFTYVAIHGNLWPIEEEACA